MPEVSKQEAMEYAGMDDGPTKVMESLIFNVNLLVSGDTSGKAPRWYAYILLDGREVAVVEGEDSLYLKQHMRELAHDTLLEQMGKLATRWVKSVHHHRNAGGEDERAEENE